MDANFDELIPELPEWNEGRGINVKDWICCVGSFEHLIGYLEFLWPRFVEHRGCVFREGFSQESFEGFLKQTGGDTKAVEATINHTHIIDIFNAPELEPTKLQVLHIGRKLKDLWSCKLARDFPHLRFVVSFPEEEFQSPHEYEITFFQQQHDPAG